MFRLRNFLCAAALARSSQRNSAAPPKYCATGKCFISPLAFSAPPSCLTISISIPVSCKPARIGFGLESKREAIRFRYAGFLSSPSDFHFSSMPQFWFLGAAAFHHPGLTTSRRHQRSLQASDARAGRKPGQRSLCRALLCSGQNSTLTGTLAGQIVMEGFIHLQREALATPLDHSQPRHYSRP